MSTRHSRDRPRPRAVPAAAARGPAPLARPAAVLAAVLAWWLVCDVLARDNAVLGRMGPGPTAVAVWDLLQERSTAVNAAASLRRLLTGLALAAVAGVPLGLLLGSRRLLEHATAPIVAVLRTTSPLAWAPLAIVLLGVGDAPVAALVALAAIWPMTLTTAHAVRGLDPAALQVVRSLGASRVEVLGTVVVPALRPHVLAALRLALGIGWVVLVPAEMLGVDSGLGYAVLNARDQLDYPRLAATIVLIGATGFLLDRLLQPPTRTGGGR
ncbi:ABC transporter permease [Kineococcus sp. LSe6-4]|uniref:ABC transporter permease n=1 Tax=Kineococcus halophytocola TaxID=3234027 RepID=A0ABV4H1C9_9ACTN